MLVSMRSKLLVSTCPEGLVGFYTSGKTCVGFNMSEKTCVGFYTSGKTCVGFNMSGKTRFGFNMSRIAAGAAERRPPWRVRRGSYLSTCIY